MFKVQTPSNLINSNYTNRYLYNNILIPPQIKIVHHRVLFKYLVHNFPTFISYNVTHNIHCKVVFINHNSRNLLQVALTICNLYFHQSCDYNMKPLVLENAFFRLGILPALTGCLTDLPIPILTTDFRLVVISPNIQISKNRIGSYKDL